jgi:hypothetical protein
LTQKDRLLNLLLASADGLFLRTAPHKRSA